MEDKVCEYEICTGCGLCAAQCPKHCITMTINGSLGHLYPKIDLSVCVDCGLCRKKCPSLHPLEQKKPLIAYAAWSKDENNYKTSTSGGVASVLSEYIISQGGAVYGCAMLPNIEVKHIRIDKNEDIKKLKGSKYVQSSIVEIIPQLKKDVLNNTPTLFIGTPCQVAAIKKMFKVQPDNLFLVDLICHGVPSVNLLKRHVKKIADYPHYDNIVFRDGNYIVVVVVVNGKEVYRKHYNKPRYKDFYINSFFDGFTYRDSCYQCTYARPERISDITIGDFWGLGKTISAAEIPSHPYGCSVVLPVTLQGKKLVEAITEKVNIYGRSVEEAVTGNNQLKHPCPFGKRKKCFRILYPYVGRSAYKVVIADKYLNYQIQRVKNKIKRMLKK